MNVLSLGYTKGLFEDEETGDTSERLTFYAKQIDRYYVLVHTKASEGYKRFTMREDFEVIPTSGKNNLASFVNMFLISRRICKRNSIDIVQTQDPIFTATIGYLLKVLYKVKLNICIYGPNVYDSNWIREKRINRLLKHIGRFILKRSDGIQVDGSKTKKDLIQHGMSPTKVYLKPMIPVNQEDFFNAQGKALREKFLSNGFERLVLFVGRLVPQKNLPVYLQIIKEVVNRVPRVLFIIVGKGPEEKHLKELATQLKLQMNIRWISQIPHSQIPQYYAACDLFALPSLYEGFARVLMEAAMTGKPIVTSNVSGASDSVIHGVSGYIVDSKKEFIERLMELLQNPDLAQKMGKQGRIFMKKNYRYEDYLRKQPEIWRAILNTESS